MIELIYYFLPAYIANMAPPFIAKLFPKWSFPLDGYISINNKRLFGNNKTLRGVIGGTILAGLVFLMQKILYPIEGIPYTSLPPWFGLIMGFGALFCGDAFKSFIKRRLNILPGRPWIPFDQIDYTLGVLLVTFGFFWPSWSGLLFLLIFNAVGAITTHYIGAKIHLLQDKI